MKIKKLQLILFAIMFSVPMAAIQKGDILTIGNTKGIVFFVDETGEHGIVMSVKALRMKKNMFCKKSSYVKGIRDNSTIDGEENTKDILTYAKSNGNPIYDYPLFEWCLSLGKGWYIPSSEELKVFVNYWLGNEVEVVWEEDDTEIETTLPDSGKTHKQKVNELLLNAGGIPFLNGVLTSTLTKNGDIVTFMYDRKKDTWRFEEIDPNDADEFTVGRAFYKF